MFHPTLHCILHSLACARLVSSPSAADSEAHGGCWKAQNTPLTVWKDVAAFPSVQTPPPPIPSGNHKTDICHFDKPEYLPSLGVKSEAPSSSCSPGLGSKFLSAFPATSDQLF